MPSGNWIDAKVRKYAAVKPTRSAADNPKAAERSGAMIAFTLRKRNETK
jgi:hypothetical protein